MYASSSPYHPPSVLHPSLQVWRGGAARSPRLCSCILWPSRRCPGSAGQPVAKITRLCLLAIRRRWRRCPGSALRILWLKLLAVPRLCATHPVALAVLPGLCVLQPEAAGLPSRGGGLAGGWWWCGSLCPHLDRVQVLLLSQVLDDQYYYPSQYLSEVLYCMELGCGVFPEVEVVICKIGKKVNRSPKCYFW